ncbi:MAG: hypothetical protein ACHQT6_08000 [Candidatus Acidiferrales bacterium]
MDETAGSAAAVENAAIAEPRARGACVAWSSLFLAFVQSVCAAFVALSGLRILIGAAAVASAAGVLGFVDRHIHIDTTRIPMVLLALAGALFNLVAVWQVRRLRARPASAWRRKTMSAGNLNSERLQLALSVLTLLLLVVEEWYHIKFTKGF